jgi:hypothetical protein
LGYLLPPRPEPFSSTLVVFPLAASPNLVKDWVHPLVRFTSTSEFVADPVPLSFLKTRAPLLGFRSRSRHQHRGFIFLDKGSRSFAYLPSPAFLPLSTVCSPRSLASLFHPAATYGIPSSRAFPAAKLVVLVGVPCPLDVCQPSPATRRSSWRQLEPSRLQGFSPDSSP